MKLVWGDHTNPSLNDALGAWCQTRIGLHRAFQPPFTTMGVFDKDALIAVVVFHNWYPENGVCELSGASTTARWMPRPVLFEMFSYPFDQLGCQNVIMRVSEANTRLFRILTAYGFKNTLIPRLRGRDEGERIFWLTDDAWRSNRFHKENAHGQISAQAA